MRQGRPPRKRTAGQRAEIERLASYVPEAVPARLPTRMHLRRLTVLREAGIDQKQLATLIDPPKSRQAVGQVIWDTFRSPMAGARIAESIVRVLQDRFRALGHPKRAEEVTMSYLGWSTPDDVAMSKRADDVSEA